MLLHEIKRKSIVSILILLEVILEAVFRVNYQQRLIVSILILLEVILEALMVIATNHLELSFNPYFTGSNSGSVYSGMVV